MDTNILIEVSDLDIITEANEERKRKETMADAIMMARDAIGIKCINAEDEGKKLAKPSPILNLDILNSTFEEKKTIISLVDVDLAAYRRMLDNKTVRRNVKLPNWDIQFTHVFEININLMDSVTSRFVRFMYHDFINKFMNHRSSC